MKSVIAICVVMVYSVTLYAQDNTLEIPMSEDRWEFDSSRVEFITHQSVPAARGLDGGAQLFLKDFEFSDGTIEFDVDLSAGGFIGINFRESADRKETENFYIRAFWPVGPHRRTALQYATVIDGTSMWDLTDEYQAAASIHREGWNHVKLVVSGRQMQAYVNEMDRPALQVPVLEGLLNAGGLSFGGQAVFASLVVSPGVTEELPSSPGAEPAANDPHYLRNWRVTEPVMLPFDRTLVFDLPTMFERDLKSDLPDESTQWQPIRAKHRGVVNLNRLYGSPTDSNRRLVWLKTTIQSETTMERRLDLGFSDEVWVFINGQILHIDQNYFGTPQMKEPRGRAALDNATIDLPLQEGDNELLIGVSNYFFGWGIIARLDDVEGLILQ